VEHSQNPCQQFLTKPYFENVSRHGHWKPTNAILSNKMLYTKIRPLGSIKSYNPKNPGSKYIVSINI
jgi:hypothetical protein